jgi:uncharacterized membrane protein YuzA (DUF378 family)
MHCTFCDMYNTIATALVGRRSTGSAQVCYAAVGLCMFAMVSGSVSSLLST